MDTILQEINIVQNQIEVCNKINDEKIFKIQQEFKKKMYQATDRKYYQCQCGSILICRSKRQHLKTQSHKDRMGQ